MADEYIRKQDAVMQLSHNKSRGDDEWELAVASDMEIIRKLPPANVVQVRHGHWTLVGWHKGMKVVECSCCKKRAIGATDFCPNCGAKMDGGDEHE